MARDINGVFAFTAGTAAVSGAPANSSHVNTRFADILADLNAARPITAGGTGATNAAAALANLGLTATAAELNILDGVTATATQLNSIGVQHLATLTASSSATLAFTGFDSSKYSAYSFHFVRLVPATDAVTFRARTSTDGGSSYDSGASDYEYTINQTTGAGGSAILAATAGSMRFSGSLSNVAGRGGFNGTARINGPDGASYGFLYSTAGYMTEANELRAANGVNVRKAAADIDGIQFFMESGNIASGEIIVFGHRFE